MTINISKELYVAAPDKYTSESRTQAYVNGTGLKRVEHKALTGESDWHTAGFERYSLDNGKTWGPWRDVYKKTYEKIGEHEVNIYYGTESYNQIHSHFVSVGMRRIFYGGHKKAYEESWGKGKASYVDHTLMVVRKDGKDERSMELIKYEDGEDFDANEIDKAGYRDKNKAYLGNAVDVMENGDIIFPVSADIRACARILGLEIKDLFPSCPDIMHGLIVVNGRFNPTRGNYDLKFSKPALISDLKSSRGVQEPEAVVLPSGRILVVFRGSNVQSENWNTRIEPGTPSHKWYCYSDDGGMTFTDPMPWHFDDCEVFYSSSSYHRFVRSEKNQEIYWIGNISDHTAYGNYPRHPLVICRVDARGLLEKKSLAIIDKREEGDSEELQLSNFCVLQDRQTGIIEIFLNKLGQREGYTWWADCYRYFVEV